jgi:hypothetical protein
MLFSVVFDYISCYNLTYFIAIVIVSTFQYITLFDIHRNMKIITLLSNYSYIITISIDGGTDQC